MWWKKKKKQEALCDLLDKDGKESLEMAVCREASEKSPRAFWAFRRLGYLQVLIYLPIYLFLFYVDINRLIDLLLLSIRRIKRNGLKLYKVFNMPFGAILPALSYGKYVFYGPYICSLLFIYLFINLHCYWFCVLLINYAFFVLGSGSCLPAFGQVHCCS